MKRNKILIYSVPLIIILTGLLIYQYGYLRVRADLSSIKEETAIRMEKLKRYHQLISERPLLEERLSELKRQRAEASVNLIDAQTSALAGASLQNIVKEIFIKNGGIVASERTEKIEEKDKFRMVSVTLNGSVPDTNSLREIIHAIETNTPSLFVKNLDIRVNNFRNPTGELMMNLTVSALTVAK